MIICTDVGELLLLKWMLQATSTPETLVLHLYSNNYTPTSSSTLANFTECDFVGYSAQTLSRATWGNPTTVSGAASSTYGAIPSYTAGSGQTIYGAYLTGATSTTTVVFAARFATPKTVVNGEVFTVPTMTFTLNTKGV